MYEFTKLGYTVLVPLSDSDKYDLIIDTGVSVLKVQVKTSSSKPKVTADRRSGRCRYHVQLCTSGGNTKKHTVQLRQDYHYDILFVVVETGQCWSIPMSALTANRSIIVDTTDICKYNQYKL
ncbi:MAG: group I intron-associated PD-(D/E)XK endonuclease [Nitrososphaeraceae archaeon]